MARPPYRPPTLVSLDSAEVLELIGPFETQYGSVTLSAADCLPRGPLGDTVQDNWQLDVPAAPTRVRIRVDVPDSSCLGVEWDSCRGLLGPGAGPLDPKVALYPPGSLPVPGPFSGYVSAECGATSDTGCAPKPPDACFMCDNLACSDPTVPGAICATFELDLPTPGRWILAVAPQAPSLVPQSRGCYALTVTALGGRTLGSLVLAEDDVTVTFRPQR